MHSDFDDEIWSDPVYNRDDGIAHLVLGFMAGLAAGCLIAAFVVGIA